MTARLGAIAGFAARCTLALLFVLAALLSPLLGFGASEYYEDRTFFWVLESDWLMGAALLAGGACIGAAAHLVGSVFKR